MSKYYHTMEYVTLSSLGNLALASTLVASVDISSAISAAFDEKLSNFLDKRTSNVVSGDITIANNDFAVLCGNFTLGNSCVVDGENSIAGGVSSEVAGNQSFAFGENVKVLGDNVVAFGKDVQVGLKGWYYVAFDFASKSVYLSAQQPPKDGVLTSDIPESMHDTSFDSGLQQGDVLSFVNNAKYDNAAIVQSVSGNKITLASNPFSVINNVDELNVDDYSAYCFGRPSLGTSDIDLGQFASAFGENAKALNKWSHAEGRDTLAYGQYAHAEGRQTQAAYASHAEGKGSKADGQYAHAQGQDTIAGGLYSHAGGRRACALGDGSFAHGNECSAIGRSSIAIGGIYEGPIGGAASGVGSMAFGPQAKALDNCSLVWNGISSVQKSSNGEGSFSIYPKHGINGFYVDGRSLSSILSSSTTSISADVSGALKQLTGKVDKTRGNNATLALNAILVYGNNASAVANHDIVIGDNSYALSGKSLIFGNNSCTLKNYGIAIGDNIYVSGEKSFAFGNSTSSMNSFAYAYGKNSIASGNQSRSIGDEASATSSFSYACGKKVSATDIYARAIGYNSIATKDRAIAVGENLSGINSYALMLGRGAQSTADKQFIWSAGASEQGTYAPPARPCTFNINPLNGIKGFYVGNDNFVQCVLSAVQMMTNEQKTALKAALGI